MSTDRVRKGVKEGGQFAASSRPEATGVSLGTDGARYDRARSAIKHQERLVGTGLDDGWDRTRLSAASAAVDCAEASSIIKKAFPDAITFGVTIPKDTGTPPV